MIQKFIIEDKFLSIDVEKVQGIAIKHVLQCIYFLSNNNKYRMALFNVKLRTEERSTRARKAAAMEESITILVFRSKRNGQSSHAADMFQFHKTNKNWIKYQQQISSHTWAL